MFKKIAAGLVCLTLVAVGITSFQGQVNLPGKFQLVSSQEAGGYVNMYKINTMNGDTWFLETDSKDYENKWHPLTHAPMAE